VGRYLVAVFGAICAGLWGYAIPSYVCDDWRWRLLSIPGACVVGALLWLRAMNASPEESLALVAVSRTEQIVVTVGAAMAGLIGGLVVPLILTREFPRWTVMVPLGLTLALVLSGFAWNHPSLFFKNRSF